MAEIEAGLNREAINIRAALIMPIIKSSKIVLKMVKITCCWILSEDDITNISLQQKNKQYFQLAFISESVIMLSLMTSESTI